MSLDEYARKRSFHCTPEPSGAPIPQPGRQRGTRFFIQRHHARRLHYDLRLEIAGALKSWAVPKGPTLDPAEKRLAVQVEDHPLEYGDFEGTIPQGNYGAGSVTLWDRGTYELLGEKTVEEQLERGDLKFRLHGEKLAGEFALVRMKDRGKGKEWLLLKKKDFAAKPGWDAEQDLRSVSRPAADPASLPGATAAAFPDVFPPMLAVPAELLPHGPEWLYEVKWDGVRALCFIHGNRVRLISRTGKAMDRQYPELAAIRQQVAADTAILDGEVVALDDSGKPSFALLQPRMMAGGSSAAGLARAHPVQLFVFDLLYLNGYDLRHVPLYLRQQALASILKLAGPARVSETFPGNEQKLLEAVRQQGLEGVVAKRASSFYESKRSPQWLKVKVVAQQDFVICGYLEGERNYFASLVLGIYDHGELRYAGNVGTGFDQELLRKIHQRLQPLVTPRYPFPASPEIGGRLFWTRPELVCSVRFSAWTRENRLRAPVFLGLRSDVAPRDCVRESTVPSPPATTGLPGEPEETAPAPAVKPSLLSGRQNEVFVAVDGRRLKFTNLNKVFYPREAYTKRDVINFYDEVAELILPHLRGRPLSLKRYPNGIDGEYFFQKQAADSFPTWLRTEAVFSGHNQAPTHFVVADDRATLLYLANLACIDQNPWLSRVGSLENPDFILIDLDPHGCEYDRIVEAAQLVRQKLELLELEGHPKTTGGDGMHIYVPVEPRYSYAQTRTFAEILARLLSNERPDLFTTPRPVARREKGKVYFDYLQNAEAKTISAPYVLRAYPGAPVSTPLSWREVTRGLSPSQFHMGNVRERFQRLGDLFRPVLERPQRIENSLNKMEELVRAAAAAR